MLTRYHVLISAFVLMALASEAWADALPGALAVPTSLESRLEAALQAKGPDYRPRTEHLQADGKPRFTNRLIAEDSPYLLQHAHNPVNWFAWGEEAFEKARREKKPIFLSIGYATCHWCHVMERESFENIPIARYLNEHFVAIKVDRERRPDLDELYMTAVVLITGQGGWPMSTFLTPDRKPFLGGTYFPPQAFLALLERIQDLWTTRQTDLVIQAEQLAAAVSQTLAAGGEARQIGEAAIQQGVAAILGGFNERSGGFGDAPKFPHESYLMLLLHAAQKRQDDTALAAVTLTLDAMARGGIYDQVGGGFHRYATDGLWRVPHFEKMLYTQALLASIYTGAYRRTGQPRYARIARQTLAYVLRDMTSPAGAFYSATDADSAGREGAFFIWTPEQIRSALPPREAALAIDLYGVTPEGNFEGGSILYLPVPLEEYARRAKLPLAGLLSELDTIRGRLRLAREKRPQPLGDDKVITAWNGMMITALAEAAEVFAEPRFLEAAERCANFLWSAQRRDDGGLWRVHWRDHPSTPATQDDYAYFAQALIGLYDASDDPTWLQRARLVTDAMLARFWDEGQGGFFMSPSGDGTLFARPKNPTDSAIPSGNSVAVRVLAALAKRTGEDRYRNKADATVAAFSGQLERSPGNFSYMLLGLDEHLHGETGHRQYAARGHLKATAKLVQEDDGLTVTLGLAMAPGWHINAHQPRQDYLIPTTVSLAEAAAGWRLDAIEYPGAEPKKLGFENQLLALYQGNLALRAHLVPTPNALARDGGQIALELRMQACNDRACLPPETLRLDIPLTLTQDARASAAHGQ